MFEKFRFFQGSGSSPENTPRPENPEMRAVAEVSELVAPRTGDGLRYIVYEEIYRGAKDQERAAHVAALGYDVAGLQATGEKIYGLVEQAGEARSKGNARENWQQDAMYDQLVRSPKVEHYSGLTIGLCAELSRQMRKFVAATIDEDAAKREEIFYSQSGTRLTDEQVTNFVRLCRERKPEMIARQEALIRSLQDDALIRQHTFAADALTRAATGPTKPKK